MHVINQKIVTRKKNYFMQINCIISFDPNLLPSSQRGRLSVVVWLGYSELVLPG